MLYQRLFEKPMENIEIKHMIQNSTFALGLTSVLLFMVILVIYKYKNK